MSRNTQKFHTTGNTTKLQRLYDVTVDYWRDFRYHVLGILLSSLVVAVLLHQPPPPPLQPVIIVATPSTVPTPSIPTATLVSRSTETRLSAAVVAYAAPNGNVLGPIEADRAYTIIARYGNDWLQADVAGSGQVWLRSAELGTVTIAADLSDLQPPPTAAVVYVVQEVPPPTGMTPVAHASASPREGEQPTPIREKPTLVLRPGTEYLRFPTAVPLPRTPGVAVSSAAYEACRRSGKEFGACVHHMPDDYFSLATGE